MSKFFNVVADGFHGHVEQREVRGVEAKEAVPKEQRVQTLEGLRRDQSVSLVQRQAKLVKKTLDW